ncbi:MAG: hypothetical protein ACYDBJ_06750 [Aggregatilineales bacterium]
MADLEHMLRAGLGRAVSHIKQHDPIPLRQTILNACLHNVAFDRQLEGSRVVYLFDILDATHEVEFYRPQILSTLDMLNETADEHDVALLYNLTQMFAQRGDAEARAAIYRKFDAIPGLGGFDGANAIIDLDGLNGFQHVAERLRKHLLANGDEFVLGENVYFLDEKLAEIFKTCVSEAEIAEVWAEQGKELYIAGYVTAVVAETGIPTTVAGPKPTDLASVGYDEIKSLIENPKGGNGWHVWKWGKQAGDEDILRAAHDLLAETDSKRLLLYLDIFRKRAFPLEPAKLITLARNGHDPLEIWGENRNEADRLALWALNALENVAHSSVRVFALEGINAGYLIERMVGLLQRNFVEGDWAMIQELTERDLDPDKYHWLGFSVLDVFDQNPSDTTVGSLLNLYEKGLCSDCRYRIVERLYRLNAIPDWMREECLYDANLDLREAARNGFEKLLLSK